MDIKERLLKCEADFKDLKARREDLLSQASDCLTEMTKLQGEYRVLQELSPAEDQINQNPLEVTAEPETKVKATKKEAA